MESFTTDRRATCSLRGRGVQGPVRAFRANPLTRNRWRLNRSCPYNGVSKPTLLKAVPHWQNQTISTRSARKNWKKRKSRKKNASASWIARPNRRSMRTPRRPSPAKKPRPPEPFVTGVAARVLSRSSGTDLSGGSARDKDQYQRQRGGRSANCTMIPSSAAIRSGTVMRSAHGASCGKNLIVVALCSAKTTPTR
jgi:hypothetical protein